MINGVKGASARYRFSGMPGQGADNLESVPARAEQSCSRKRRAGPLTATTTRAALLPPCSYFSWNAGPAHFISLASFFPSFAANSGMTKWLTADLQKVDRSVTPWIIVEVHAPW